MCRPHRRGPGNSQKCALGGLISQRGAHIRRYSPKKNTQAVKAEKLPWPLAYFRPPSREVEMSIVSAQLCRNPRPVGADSHAARRVRQDRSGPGFGFSQTAFQKIQKDILKHCWPTGRDAPVGHKGTCRICRRKIPKKRFKTGLPAGKSMRGFFKTLPEGQASLGQNRQGKSVFCIR